MTAEENTEIREVNVSGLCRLVRLGEIREGDRFLVHGSLVRESITKEIVFRIQDGNAYTLVYQISDKSDNPPPWIGENMYSGQDESVLMQESFFKGQRDYHKILPEVEE